MNRFFILSIFIVLLYPQMYSQSDWDSVISGENIEVYTRNNNNSKVKEVKITARMESTMIEMVAALEDIEAHKEWVPYTIDSKVLKQVSDTELYYYVSSDFPFPAKDRDVIIHYRRSQDADSRVVTTTSQAVPDYISESSDFVRIPLFNSKYILSPKPGGIIDILYTVQTNPGGKLPAWIVNFGITKGPIKTMNALRKLLSSGKYADELAVGVIN